MQQNRISIKCIVASKRVTQTKIMKTFKKRILQLLVFLALLYVALLIPGSDDQPLFRAKEKPFTWNSDSLWMMLEQNFKAAKNYNQSQLDSTIDSLRSSAENSFNILSAKPFDAADSNLTSIQNSFFRLAPLIAVNGKEISWYTDYYNRVRVLIKEQSQNWYVKEPFIRDRIYKLLYGMRAAIEEVLLQSEKNDFPSAMKVKDEKSVTPAASIFGIEVHSGDMLVSRGGAEVSALISRGNDYPGNFSHIAFLYIEEQTKKPWLVEAHIEKGVAVSSIEQYEKDKKLRFMVMRPRADLPAMIANPMLPQKAARRAYEAALARHIPYDFKMNFHDSSAMFCSEVASWAYDRYGLQFWQTGSTISSKGVVDWLHDFGVENFVTQMPSDLEYDPQLSVVAEWRDMETLYKDHIDNAVMDAMLEQADKGVEIKYNHWLLPIVRVVKGYCMLKNAFGKPGMIPEGMSATRALKNQTFVAMHVAIKSKTEKMAADFISQNHYRPPYWRLVKFAEAAAKEVIK